MDFLKFFTSLSFVNHNSNDYYGYTYTKNLLKILSLVREV